MRWGVFLDAFAGFGAAAAAAAAASQPFGLPGLWSFTWVPQSL